jgi:septal ring factor EnvC (AmiA/AmiB activator)
MTSDVSIWEAELCTAYREQADLYRQATQLAGPLAGLVGTGQDYAERVAELMSMLEKAAQLAEQVRPVKEQWIRANGKPGTELQVVLTDVAQQIDQLTRTIAGAGEQAASRHAALAPQLDAMIRGCAMRRAYGSPDRSINFSQ